MHNTFFCRKIYLLFFGLMVFSGLSKAIVMPWQTNYQHPDAQIRVLISGEVDQQTNSVMAALDIHLVNGWKTYWRSPGEGGLAPEVDWQVSENVEGVQWLWPVPKRFDVAGIQTFGYPGSITIPLSFKVSDLNKPVWLNGTFWLPTCTNMCVLTDYPLDITFTPSELIADGEAQYLINKSLARVPGFMPDGGMKADSLIWDETNKVIKLSVESETGWVNPDVILDGIEEVSFGEPEVVINDSSLEAIINVDSLFGDFNLGGQALNVTLIDQGLAVEQRLYIQSGVAESVAQTPVFDILLMLFVRAIRWVYFEPDALCSSGSWIKSFRHYWCF